MSTLWRSTARMALFLLVGIFAAKNAIGAEAVPMTVVINVSHNGEPYFVPVKVQISSTKLALGKADTPDKQTAFATRILHQNVDRLPVVTDGFKHYNDVRMYLDVPYDPGAGAHIHTFKRDENKKICGRICCTNDDGKQCCMIIICPGDCEC